MKKFNKMMTVKMEANIEVLPLNTTFVARMMQAKAILERRNDVLCDTIACGCNENVEYIAAVQSDVVEVLNFFQDLYNVMTQEDEKETKLNGPIGTREQPNPVF